MYIPPFEPNRHIRYLFVLRECRRVFRTYSNRNRFFRCIMTIWSLSAFGVFISNQKCLIILSNEHQLCRQKYEFTNWQCFSTKETKAIFLQCTLTPIFSRSSVLSPKTTKICRIVLEQNDSPHPVNRAPNWYEKISKISHQPYVMFKRISFNQVKPFCVWKTELKARAEAPSIVYLIQIGHCNGFADVK